MVWVKVRKGADSYRGLLGRRERPGACCFTDVKMGGKAGTKTYLKFVRARRSWKRIGATTQWTLKVKSDEMKRVIKMNSARDKITGLRRNKEKLRKRDRMATSAYLCVKFW